MALEAQNNPFTSILMVGAADPEALPDADPPAGSYRIAPKTDGTLWIVDSAGSAVQIGAGFSGDAGDIPFTPVGTIAATDVQAAIAEVASEAAGVPAATSFPGSPANNDLFYRTDRDRLYFYDGTRWLTVQEFPLTLGILDTLAPVTSGGSPGAVNYAPTDQGDNGMWATRLVCMTITPGTLDGSNFWTYQLQSRLADGTATNLGASFTSAADTAGQNPKHVVTIGAVVDASATNIRLLCTKTGTPGGAYPTAVLYYRLIG
jgi:hypothetical protein